MIEVLRREEKYPLHTIEARRQYKKFTKLLSLDSHSKNGSYMVRSLYFDTMDDKDFFDKVTEQNKRRKIRLRIYSPADTKVKLEIKQKENIFQRKRSLVISREDALSMIQGQYDILLKYEEPFAAELHGIMVKEGYRPKSVVEYQRSAFMLKENNIRLTFDSDIRATESSCDLFSENLPLYPVFPTDRVIFEVKYDRFLLGYVSDIISSVDEKQIASSKYCLSRSIGYTIN